MTYEKFKNSAITHHPDIKPEELVHMTVRLSVSFCFVGFVLVYLCACTLPTIAVPLVGLMQVLLFVFCYDWMAEDERAFNLGDKISRFWFLIVIVCVAALVGLWFIFG